MRKSGNETVRVLSTLFMGGLALGPFGCRPKQEPSKTEVLIRVELEGMYRIETIRDEHIKIEVRGDNLRHPPLPARQSSSGVRDLRPVPRPSHTPVIPHHIRRVLPTIPCGACLRRCLATRKSIPERS